MSHSDISKNDLLMKAKNNYILLTILFCMDVLYCRYSFWSYKYIFVILFTFIISALLFRHLYKKLLNSLNNINTNEEISFVKLININNIQSILLFVIFLIIGPLSPSGIKLMYNETGIVFTILFIILGIFFWFMTVKILSISLQSAYAIMSKDQFILGKKSIFYENIKDNQILKLHSGDYEFIFYNEKQLLRLRINEEQKDFLENCMQNNTVGFL